MMNSITIIPKLKFAWYFFIAILLCNVAISQNNEYKYIIQEGFNIQVMNEDHSLLVPWGHGNLLTGAGSESDGKPNTQAIVSKHGNWSQGNYAANICAQLNAHGFDDWYLPSIDELQQMYKDQHKIGGFGIAVYWSSTEDINGITVQQVHFPAGYILKNAKSSLAKVRCVRTDNTFTDLRDGQIYKWDRIGNQVWMAENLNLKVDGSLCYDYNEENCKHYGRLYNWYTAMANTPSSVSNPSGVQGVCPNGWHLPSEEEWIEFVDFFVAMDYPNLFDSDNPNGAGNAMKSCRQVNSSMGEPCKTDEHPRWNADHHHQGFDAYGFSALPGGLGFEGKGFQGLGEFGIWWAATECTPKTARERLLYHNGWLQWLLDADKEKRLLSVRCIKD